MAVTIKQPALSAALRLGDSPEENAQADRLLDVASVMVEKHAPGAPVDPSKFDAFPLLGGYLHNPILPGGLGAYPRVGGGTTFSAIELAWTSGLSPRVRGNRVPAHQVRALLRSIPARAGEPVTVQDALTKAQVYPRACGGTQSISYCPR